MARKNKPVYKENNYVALPRRVIEHQNFADLSGNSVKLLMLIFGQFRGTNNGDLCAPHSIMKDKGFTSRDTLSFSLAELLHYKFLITTRHGGNHICSLYAVAWIPRMDCGDKIMEPVDKLPRWKEREVVQEKLTYSDWRNRKKKITDTVSVSFHH